jgi:chromosome segregation ATPase
VRSDEISREIVTLKKEIAALRAAEREEYLAAAHLEAQMTELRYRLTLARGAVADHEKKIREKRAELEEAVVQEVHQRFQQVMQERDTAAAALAEAAEVLLERLAALDRSQEAVVSAWAAAQPGGAARPSDLHVPPEIAAEPEVMRESWERLCLEIRNRISERFEDELVDAASSSPLGSAINDLPLHLREVARQRRHAMIRLKQVAEGEYGTG